MRNFTRKVIERTPLIGAIEGTVPELLSAFFAKERRFSHPVLVQMSGATDLEKLGFISRRT